MGRSARYQTSSGFIAPRSIRGWVGNGGHDGGYSPRSDKLQSTGMLHRNRKHTQTMDGSRSWWDSGESDGGCDPSHGHNDQYRRIRRDTLFSQTYPADFRQPICDWSLGPEACFRWRDRGFSPERYISEDHWGFQDSIRRLEG